MYVIGAKGLAQIFKLPFYFCITADLANKYRVLKDLIVTPSQEIYPFSLHRCSCPSLV